MSKQKEQIFLWGTAGICLLLFGVKLTGAAVHCVLGFILTVIMVLHIRKRKNRMLSVPGRIKKTSIVLAFLLAVLVLSGISAHLMKEAAGMKILHKVSGVLLCIGITIHVMQHNKMRKELQRHVS